MPRSSRDATDGDVKSFMGMRTEGVGKASSRSGSARETSESQYDSGKGDEGV